MFYIRHNDALGYIGIGLLLCFMHTGMLKKLRSIGLKTQKMSLTIIKLIGDELISDKSIFGFYKFC